jgi:hypothetical protein
MTRLPGGRRECRCRTLAPRTLDQWAAVGGGRAKDLGIISIANSGPRVLAPAIAAPLVSQLGGYPTLFLSVAAITVLGSAFVWKIRSIP